MTAEYCKDCTGGCVSREPCPKPALLPCNLPVVSAYGLCHTQWRHAPSGHRTGLDYAAVLASLAAAHTGAPKRARRLFGGIRAIEAALLEAQHERWKAEQEANGRGH